MPPSVWHWLGSRVSKSSITKDSAETSCQWPASRPQALAELKNRPLGLFHARTGRIGGMEEKKKTTSPEWTKWPRWPRGMISGLPGQIRWVDAIVRWVVILYLAFSFAYLFFVAVILWRIFRGLSVPNF
jgi:hypothetical protein